MLKTFSKIAVSLLAVVPWAVTLQGADTQPHHVAPLKTSGHSINEKGISPVVSASSTLARKAGTSRRITPRMVVAQNSATEPVTLPWFNNIDEKTDFNEFTVIDANGDGTTWAWSSKTARVGWGDGDMDDWLIMPPMYLSTDKAYNFEFDIRGNSTSYVERYEVKMGNAPTPDAMTVTLVEPTDIRTGDYIHMSLIVMPETEGIHYIGIHGISTEADGFYLYVNDVGMSAPISRRSPSAVSDISVVPGADGALSASVKFRAPSTLVNGDPAGSLTKIEVLEGTTLLGTVNAPTPGAECSVDVILTAEGDHTFTIVAYNEEGAGTETGTTAYVGINYPAAPDNVTITEAGNSGEVTVAWEAVSTDAEGWPLSASQITYSIVHIPLDGDDPEVIYDGLTDTSCTFQAVPEGEQDMVSYAVYASTSRGAGQATQATPIFVGTPYSEFAESFANGAVSHNLAIMTWSEEDATWLIQTDQSLTNVTSQDGDNGFILMNGRMLDIRSAIGFGKISLAERTSPGLVFYTLGLDDGEGNPDINLVEMWVKEKGSSDFTTIFSKTVDELAKADQWGRVVVDLGAYAGKEVELAIGGTIKFYTNIMFDNITLTDLNNHDLSVGLSGPARAVNQTDFTLVAKVHNLGKMASGAYTVQLKADGDLIGTAQSTGLAANATEEFEFTHRFQAIQHDMVDFTAEVLYSADEVPGNNASEPLSVQPKESLLPAVTDLSGVQAENGGVHLTWSQPDMTTGAETHTDRFEDGTAGDKTYGSWTFVDVDNVAVTGFRGVEIPGIESNKSTASFFMFDGSLPQFNETFAAHSGTKYLVSLARYDFKEVDDWAISPELSGESQSVSFFARSYDPRYLEKIEVYYSTGSKDPADFELLTDNMQVPGNWTEYIVDLPAGAKHFAIRSCAADAMMLMVDDISYETRLAAESLSLTGYNVYRDRTLITSNPVETCTFTDSETTGNHSYIVTAVYTSGESKGSNEVCLAAGGIDNISDNISVRASEGMIVIEGASGRSVKICTLAGRVMLDCMGRENMTVSATPGVYVGHVDGKAFKIIVK